MSISELTAVGEEFKMSLQELFNRASDLVDDQEADCQAVQWWIEEYPTLGSAEAELIEMNEQTEELKPSSFSNYGDYLSELARLDYNTMMLEMVIDLLYSDWEPKGEKLSSFKIGTLFRSGSGRWICTDVGQRTIVAIRYTPRAKFKMAGPPYGSTETVWGDFDIGGVTILS